MITIRQALGPDTPAVAKLFARTCRESLPFLQVLHTPEEDLAFFGGLVATGGVTVAAENGTLLGFMAESPGWIEHLYLAPEAQGRGLGARLVSQAQGRQDRLELWCFAQNLGARAFYERMGFRPVRETEGENEQGLPDILFRWER